MRPEEAHSSSIGRTSITTSSSSRLTRGASPRMVAFLDYPLPEPSDIPKVTSEARAIAAQMLKVSSADLSRQLPRLGARSVFTRLSVQRVP